MGSQTSVKKSFAWSFLEQGSARAISLIVQIVLARMLAPETFGLMAILLVVVNVADSIAQSGLGSALIQSTDTDDTSYITAFWLSIALAVAMYLLVFFCGPAIAAFYSMTELTPYLRVLGVVLFTNSFNSIQRSYLQRELDFKSLFKVNLLAVLLSGLLGVIAAGFGAGLWALVAQSIASSLLSCLFMRRYVQWNPAFVFDWNKAKNLWSYGWKLCVTGVINVLYNGVSELVIGKACNPTALGYYSQGRKYPNQAISIIMTAISNVLFPAFSKTKDDRELFMYQARKALYVGTFVVAPISILLIAIAKPLVLLLLTEKWLPCVLIFQLALLPNALLMFQLVNLRAYMALGNSSLYMWINIAKIVIGGTAICLTAILTKDIYATASATCGVGVLGTLFIDMSPAKSMYGYSALSQLKDQLPVYGIAACAFAAAMLCLLIPASIYIQMIIEIIVFCGVYLGLAKLLNLKAFQYCLQILPSSVKSKLGN